MDMNKGEKQIWRKNFEITRTHLQMATPALYDMMILQKPTLGQTVLKEGVWVQQGYKNTATYFIVSELRRLIENTIKVIVKNPAKIKKVHQKALALNRDLFILSKKLLKIPLKKLNNHQLSLTYQKIIKLFLSGNFRQS